MFSIIIPTYNNLPYLKVCVDSIFNSKASKFEIICHVSEDLQKKTRQFLKKKNIKYTFSEKNLGLCTAINTATKKANNKYILYSHDDMYFCPNWEEILEKEIFNIGHNKFYLSGSMIEPNSGHIKFDCGNNLQDFNEQKLLSNYKNLNSLDHQGTHFAPHCVHIDVWNKVGGFSEEFNPGIASDPDFNMKLWNLGIRIFKGIGSFKVYHFGSVTTRKNKSIVQNKGDKTFLLKWGISTKFFKKYYLKSKTKYTGPLTGPKINFYYILNLIRCKLQFFYLKTINIIKIK